MDSIIEAGVVALVCATLAGCSGGLPVAGIPIYGPMGGVTISTDHAGRTVATGGLMIEGYTVPINMVVGP